MRVKILLIFFTVVFQTSALELEKEIQKNIPEDIIFFSKKVGKKVNQKSIVEKFGAPAKKVGNEKLLYEVDGFKYGLIFKIQNGVLRKLFYKFPKKTLSYNKFSESLKGYKRIDPKGHNKGREFYLKSKEVNLYFKGSSNPRLHSIVFESEKE